MFIKEGEKDWKYTLSSYKENNNTGYYKCSDSYCNARASYSIKNITKKTNIYNNNNLDNNKEQFKENYFSLNKEHTIAYEKHSYNKYDLIKKDMLNLNKNILLKKFIDYEYLSNFLKVRSK